MLGKYRDTVIVRVACFKAATGMRRRVGEIGLDQPTRGGSLSPGDAWCQRGWVFPQGLRGEAQPRLV